MHANFGCLRSWRYSRSCPEVFPRTVLDILWRNWSGYRRLYAWGGVITLVMEVVCDLVCWAIGLGSVALSTLGGVGSPVCVTLYLVRRAMG